ncbi:MAG: D-alanine--D-alanine ligase [Chlorobi bacterium]|nr:D-alanine--D-alanine ligase [Chlorobiota bacterium]
MSVNIAILAGGNSSEFEISMNSATQVIRHLDRKLFSPYKIVLRDKNWSYEPENGGIPVPVDKNDFSLIVSGEKITFDAVFIAIHGTPGEDGKMQAYFEMLDIPFTSCNSFVSALTFNKFACKKYLEAFHVQTAPSLLTRKFLDASGIKDAGLSFPLFVKANSSGSSFGVTKVDEAASLEEAMEHAFSESSEVLIEELITGTEVTCGVLKTKQRSILFPPTEVVPHKEYFDFEAKYMPGLADEITPARLPDEKIRLIQDSASRIYDYLGCRGIVRIDFILQDDALFFLEINTVPGLSRESIIPKQAAVYGLSATELFTLVLNDSMTR